MKKKHSKFRKTWLSLGTVMGVTPIISVLACTATVDISKEKVSQKEAFESALSRDYIENYFHTKVLKRIFTTPVDIDFSNWNSIKANNEIRNLMDFFIHHNTYNDATYLKNLGLGLLSLKNDETGLKYTSQEIFNIGALTYIDGSGKLDISATKLDKMAETFFKTNVANFRTEFFKFLIGYSYLNVTGTNWNAVFQDPNKNDYVPLSALESSIIDDDFVLTYHVLRNRPFFTWETTLDEADSKIFLGQERSRKTALEIDRALKAGGEIYQIVPKLNQNRTTPSYLSLTGGLIIENGLLKNRELIGFSGIKKRESVGSGSLSFTNDEVKKITTSDEYENAYSGYLYENKVADPNLKIDILSKESPKVQVTKLLGIMPIFKNNTLSMKEVGNNSFIREIVYFSSSKDIYDEAIKYYTSKENKEFPGGLMINKDEDKISERLITIAIDLFGFKFVEKSSTT